MKGRFEYIFGGPNHEKKGRVGKQGGKKSGWANGKRGRIFQKRGGVGE